MEQNSRRKELSIPEKYIKDVLSGEVVTCKLRRRGVERHIYDLRTAKERGFYFDPEAGLRVIDFFQFLRHSKGEWAGQVITLEPWQQFDIYMIFGWKKIENDMRRFNTAFEFTARKQGKSTKASGIGTYLFGWDNEPGAEVYSAATKKDQARIVHGEAMRMVAASPLLKKRVTVYKDNLNIPGTASKFEPLASEDDSLDGLNPHGIIIDELHAHKNRQLFDVLDSATGSRRQALLYMITTAGFNKTGIGMEMYDYGRRVLEGFDVEGGTKDDSYYAAIFELDKDDDPFDESVWIKANPNLGVSCKIDDLRQKALKAKNNPAALNNFLCKNMNKWVSQEIRFIPMDRWDLVKDVPVEPEGICYGGLDLARSIDLVAWVLVFPKEDGTFHVLARFWIPGKNIKEKSTKDRVDYEAWEQQRHIMLNDKDTVNYDWIFEQIDSDAQKYDIAEIAYDRYGSEAIISKLDDMGMTVVPFGQGFTSMNAPTGELLKLVLEEKIIHGSNPIMRWNADNLIVETNAAGQIKPSKKKSTQKIDGMVALIMALDRALRNSGGGTSKYETEGLTVIG